jgi:chemotaxis protein methyltransferase CheR
MQVNQFELPIRPKLSEKDFSRISQFIHQQFGIKLPITKLTLVESRLIKRVTQLNIKSFTEYVGFVFSKEGMDELNILIDHISTNKTDFFREDIHFKFLTNHIKLNKVVRPLKFWSAACSSGEEPYSISMVLEEMNANNTFCGSYNILGTDISNTILNRAIKGEYTTKTIENIPKDYQKKYFIGSNGTVMVNSLLRKNISFKRFNLIDDVQYVLLNQKFDFIFCRNVLIYFDQPTQVKVINNLIKSLAPGGFLFLGHSETLMGKQFPVIQIQPTVYQKQNG